MIEPLRESVNLTSDEFNNLMKDSIMLGMGSEEEEPEESGSDDSGSTNVVIEAV
jgi:hypothetical protein